MENPAQSDWPGNYTDFLDIAPLDGEVSIDDQEAMYDLMWHYAYADLSSIIIFAVFIAYFKRQSKVIADQAEADAITTADYTIYVEGFSPKNTTP